MFKLKGVSEPVVEYLNLTLSDQQVITGVTQGENTTDLESCCP